MKPDIYIQTQGQGSPLLLLHGWGIGGNVWENIQCRLKNFCRASWVDIPGYGRTPNHLKHHYTLESLAQALHPLLDGPTTVLGWSLGGMIATQLALMYPHKVSKLILTATSPQFFTSTDWNHAMEAKTLDTFGSDLKHAYRETVMQFLAIQALGSDRAREEIRVLKQKVFRDGEPSYNALEEALNLLQTQNLRPMLADIHCPTLIIAGEKDRLAPVAAAQAMHALIPRSRLHTIKGTSHAPFLSHPDEFVGTIKDFMHV